MDMKKLLLLICCTIGFIAFSKAQDQQVTLGTAHDYSVAAVPGYTYTWSVDVAGSSTDLSGVTGNSINVLWDKAEGTYNITVFATDAALCKSEIETISIQVLGQSSVLFAAADDAQTCSDRNGNVDGGGASGGNSSFEVQFTGGLAPYELKYKVLDPLDAQVGAEVTVSGLSATDMVDVPNQFINDGTVNAVYKVVLVSATTKDGATVDIPTGIADNTRTITVLPKPRITGGIILN